MKDLDWESWLDVPPVAICSTCRRMIFRADGHRCDRLRDYERPTGCADHTDPDHCRICGDPTLRPDRLCDMHDQAAIDSRRPA